MRSVSVNEPKDRSIVIGDKITVRRNGVSVRIRVEYVGEDHVEGFTLRAKGSLRAGQYIAINRTEVQRNTRYQGKIAEATHLDLERLPC